ncbi:uncharacterized protein JCM6883_002383 [Sporobolomyces salmoneus]|uniref:uncharacterized protein n=1 Tax=Sporobolomyces salmoneus TaxID=183962 RepID=UPI00316D9C29
MNGLCWCACSCERCRQASLSIPRPSSSNRPLSPPPPRPASPPSQSPNPLTQANGINGVDPNQSVQNQELERGGGGGGKHSHPKPPKNRRPPPAPLSDGSPAPLPPPRPNLPTDGSVKTCSAIDRYEVLCEEVVVGGWKGKVARLWCATHEEEEKNVRTSFWNAVSSLPRLSRSSPLPSPSEITTSSSFSDLETWEQTARQHIALAKRAFESWEYHREHFSACQIDLVDRLEGRGEGPEGGDLARGAWEEVRLRGEKAEAVLKLIIRRSHFLACDAEDALWLLHTDGCPHNSYSGCGGGGYATPGSSEEGSIDEEDEEEEEDDEDRESVCSCCSHQSRSVDESCDHSHTHGGGGGTVQHHHHSHSHSHNHSHSHSNHRTDSEKPPHNPLRPPGSPTLAPENEEPDPLNALETLRRTELLELLSLTGSHASFIREGRKSVERVRIVECLFRRLISRDEELLVKAYRGGHDHVLRFFEDPALVSLPALARLHHALQRTSPTELKEAIMDAFRAIAWEESGATETEDGAEGVGMQVLGGWVYKNQLSRSMTPREWSHLYDLCACPGCAIRCCMRFSDLALIRRLTVIPHGPHPPPFELWAEEDESDAQKIFKALDVVWCEGKEVDDEGKSRRMRLGGEKGREVWAIREERNWAFLKISLAHPYALKMIDLLSQHFTLLGRGRIDGTTMEIPSIPYPPPHLLWTNRVRHAPTKALLSKPPPSPPLPHSSTISVATLASTASPWRAYPNSFNCVSSTSKSLAMDLLTGFDSLTCPEKEQDLPSGPFEECWEVLVLDAPVDSGFAEVEKYLARPLEAFEVFLAGVLCQGCGLKVPDPNDLITNSNSTTNGGGEGTTEVGMSRDATKRILTELKQSALEHGAVESFLRGDLVWDFGDVKGVTTSIKSSSTTSNNGGGTGTGKKGTKGGGGNGGGDQQVFAGVDLKKVGKDGIVAPPLPPPGVISNLPNGAKKVNPVNGNSNGSNSKTSASSTTTNGGKVNGKDKKEKVLEGLRDDKLALRLARSLFK